MDRSLNNLTPEISHADSAIQDRILAGHRAVLDQIDYFRNNFGTAQSRWKKDGTRVTEVDETISRELFSSLQRAFPNDDFCSEESEESETDLNGEFNWVLDPVDGTNNYAVGIPECAISLGLLKNGYPIYGFIYDYGRDIILQGGKKFGSIEGNTPVKASTELVNEKLTFCTLPHSHKRVGCPTWCFTGLENTLPWVGCYGTG